MAKIIKNNQDPKVAFPNARDRIVFAFELEGISYFQFHDINEVPCIRGFHCLTFYNELSMRCTREFLTAHTEAVDNILNDNKGVKITELAKLNMQLKERLDFIFEPEIAYKLCSVVFFDASENPYNFSFKYSLEKATKFMQQDMNDFFLSQPIVKLIPYINSFTTDLKAFCQIISLMTAKHLESISMRLSEIQSNKESFKSLKLLNTKAVQYLK